MSNDRDESTLDCFLLLLPTELHHLIVKELPLSSRLVYQYQVCSTLRYLLRDFNLLSYPHRFDLVEWRTAQGELKSILQRQKDGSVGVRRSDIDDSLDTSEARNGFSKQSIWDISPSSTPRPAPSKPTAPFAISHLPPLLPIESAELQASKAGIPADANGRNNLIYGDHPDVSLFVQTLRLLRDNQIDQGEKQKLLVLSLLSRSGFKVASLIHLLETDAKLCNVETVLMTSANFIDAGECTIDISTSTELTNASSLVDSL